MTVTVHFADSAGLFVGNDVGILGVPVGRITDITPEGTQVAVTLEIEGDRPVPADVGAVVVARSVATDRYVELTPVYREGATLADGADIPVERTRTPVDFDQVLETLNTFATGISGSADSVEAIREFIDAGTAALDGRGQLINDTVSGLSGAVGSLSAVRGDAVATIKALDRLVGRLVVDRDTVDTFIGQVAAVTTQLDEQKLDFRQALRDLDAAVASVADFATRHRPELTAALGEGGTLLRTLDRKQRELARILEVMPLALQNLAATVDDGRLRVRLQPTALFPGGEQLDRLCDTLPGPLCDLLSGTSPGGPTSGRTTTGGGS